MLKTYLETSKQSIEQWLSTVLHSTIPEYKRLYEAMNYSLLQGEANSSYLNQSCFRCNEG